MYPIFDLHCDTILECAKRQAPLLENTLHVDIKKLRAADSYAQCFAIFVDKQECLKEGVGAYEKYKQVLRCFRQELANNETQIAQALCVQDIVKNRNQGKLSAVLTVEGGEVLEGREERLEELYRDGVRLMTLTWNYENELSDANGRDGGLKPFGYMVLERMNELGMIADVSHISDRGFFDVLAHSKRPVVASHSCARAICPHNRNLTDEMLHKIGCGGGVVGLNFYSRFLQKDSPYATMEQVLEHALHIVNKAGIEALALGSDFDGIDCELEWKDMSGMPGLLRYMEAHFSASEMEKICYRNAQRIFEAHS